MSSSSKTQPGINQVGCSVQRRCTLFLILLAYVFPCSAKEYKLPGVRETVVTLDETDQSFKIKASFLAIDVFSESRNKQLNERKGRQYCIRGLARHLKVTEKQRLIISTDSPVDAELKDKKFAYTLSVPKTGVKVEDVIALSLKKQNTAPKTATGDTGNISSKEAPKKARKETAFKLIGHSGRLYDDFFTLWDDYRIEISQLSSNAKTSDELYDRIEELEKEISQAFNSDKHAQSFNEDTLLFSEDVKKLTNCVKQMNGDLLVRLKLEIVKFDKIELERKLHEFSREWESE